MSRAVVIGWVWAAGCAYTGTARDFDAASMDREPGWIAVQGATPLRQETESDCGAAALAMALGCWSLPTPPREIFEAAGRPPEGLRAGDLRDFARTKGLKAYLVQGQLADLERELLKRRPVLVGLVKSHTGGTVTHYELVVGIHPDRKTVVTLDPARGWRENSFEGFTAEWEPAARLMIVIFKGAE